MSALIPLYGQDGEVRAHAIVDLADFRWLSQWRWCLTGSDRPRRRESGTGRSIYMSRQILGLAHGDRCEGDHVNRNRLDNRRSNLRVVTHAENLQNLPSIGTTSSHRGVSYAATRRARKKWRVQVCVPGRRFNAWCATEEEAAAKAREFRLAHMTHAVEAVAS